MKKVVKKTKYKEALKKLKQKSKKTKSKPKPKPKKVIKPRLKKVVRKKPLGRKKRPTGSRLAKRKAGTKPKRVIKRKPVKKIKPKKSVRKIKLKKKVIKKSKPRKVIKKRVVKKVKPKRKVVKKRKTVKKRIVKKKTIKHRIYVGKGTLDQLFESQAKVKLLRFFFRNAENVFESKEVFKKLRSNAASLRQEMSKLEKLGLLKQKKAWLTFEKKRGGIRKELKKVFYIDSNFDFFNELKKLVLKSAVTSKNDLADSARKIGNIKLLVLTGVFTGDETTKADLLIVGDKINQRKLNNFIKEVEAEVGRGVNCAVLTTKEFNYRYDMYDRFVRDLLNSKIEILIKKIELW